MKKGFRTHGSNRLCVQVPSLTTSTLGPFHPRERDGPFPAALTEPQQECPRLLVLQQSTFTLLTDEAHDTPGCGKGWTEVLWGSVMILIFTLTYKSKWLELDRRTQDKNGWTILDVLKSVQLTLQKAFYVYIHIYTEVQKQSLTWCQEDATHDKYLLDHWAFYFHLMILKARKMSECMYHV